ncbi:MAG: type II secretion system secretin GspD, partial [Verrucomicrobia bacterium]|nr:type II secretion system secretin GspD [Verrucomicrobiota bacterium]
MILSLLSAQWPASAQPSPSAPPPSGPTIGRDKLINLNFRDAPLDQVLTFYSEMTGRTLIKAPGVNATITLKSQSRLTQQEALDAIESILAMHNVALVPMGEKFLKVVQTATVRKEGMELAMTLPEEPFPETDTLISQIIPLKYIEISEAQPILEQFRHGYGNLTALERTNSILVTDTAQNLQRMLEILEFIDRPIEAREDIFVRELRYTTASKVASKLNELIQQSQEEEDKPRVSSVPTPQAPPGVIRARRGAASPNQPPTTTSSATEMAAELAEKGIIRGKVKIVADDRTNILFIISRPENFSFFDKIIAVLDRPVEAEFIVEVVALEYAEAEEIAGILNEFIGAASGEEAEPSGVAGGEAAQPGDARSTALREYVQQRARSVARQDAVAKAGEEEGIGRLSTNTKILADKRTNSLLLMGRKGDIDVLRGMVEQLDIMLAQVLIESVILEVRLQNDLSYGIDWLQRSFALYNEEKAGPGGGITVRQPVAAWGGGSRVLGSDAAMIDASTVDRSSSIGGALTYYLTMFDLNIDAIIQMAAASADARVLQTPVILTTDNTEAKISVGEERPVVTTSSTTDAGTIRSSYEYRNIGINLTVTPHINPQRFVVMEINQTADGVSGSVEIDGNSVPIITKREFSASVAVDNRETIVLGGLVSTDKAKSRTKVPILGDIPILGTLFRSDSRSDIKRELLVLLTPYVLMTPEEVRDETERLHKSTNLKDSDWYRGWSDSPLAKPTKEQIKAQRKLFKKQQKEEQESRRKWKRLGLSDRMPEIGKAEPEAEPKVVEPAPAEPQASETPEAAVVVDEPAIVA